MCHLSDFKFGRCNSSLNLNVNMFRVGSRRNFRTTLVVVNLNLSGSFYNHNHASISGLQAVCLGAFRYSQIRLMKRSVSGTISEWDNTVNSYGCCSLERMRFVSHLQVTRPCLPSLSCDLRYNTTGPPFPGLIHSSCGCQATALTSANTLVAGLQSSKRAFA